MLTIHDYSYRLSDDMTRRDWLRVSGLGMLGLSATADAQEAPRPDRVFGKAKACILIFLAGGPPQHETWDPKPDAPAEIRGEFSPSATNVPGMMVCELMPRIARIVDKCCVLRAVSSGDSAH